MSYFTTFILISIFGMAIIVFAFILIEYGKEVSENAAKYDMIYEKIHRVMTYEICEANYQWIMRLLNDLGQCKYKDRERTQVITMEFFRQYHELLKSQISE